MTDRPTPESGPWTITMKAIPGNVPPTIRLRKFLKVALRSFGLKCVDIRLRGTHRTKAGATSENDPANDSPADHTPENASGLDSGQEWEPTDDEIAAMGGLPF